MTQQFNKSISHKRNTTKKSTSLHHGALNSVFVPVMLWDICQFFGFSQIDWLSIPGQYIIMHGRKSNLVITVKRLAPLC